MAGSRRVVPVDGVGTGAAGRACLYVLPCAYEDLAKLGISKDPLARLQAFSPRYFEFFDLDRGWLVEADSQREARSWETRWKRSLREHAAPAPLLVPKAAAGHTEWLRGAGDALAQARSDFIAQGFTVHDGLGSWLRQRLHDRRERLATAEQAAVLRFGMIDAWPADARGTPLAALRDALDAHRALDDEGWEQTVSPALHAWHARSTLLAG